MALKLTSFFFIIIIIGVFFPTKLILISSGCDQITFFNTNVTLVGAKDVRTINGCFSGTDDDELLRVSYIQIVNENVPILKRNAISDLPKLVDIIIDNSSVTDLESGCFYNLPKLYLIKLRHNNFKTIREGVFNKLSITELSLTNNSIETIHSKAFNDLPNLTILQLDQNKLNSWSAEWFIGSPKISVFSFEFNSITHLPVGAFQYINGLHYDADVHLNISTHLHLNNNKIRYLSDGAFNGIEIFGWLFLHRNELEEITELSLSSLKSVDWIRLEHNHLKCIPKKLIDISPKVLWYIANNPLTSECKDYLDNLRNASNNSH